MATKKRTTKSMNGARAASSAASEPSEPSEAPSEPASDEALAEFLSSPPSSADALHVVAVSGSGDAIVQTRQRSEVLRDPDGIANRIHAACEQWASTERRLVRFRASWLRGDRTVATHAFERGSSSTDPGHSMDGSVQAFLAQQQRNGLDQHKLYLESFEMVQESWKAILQIANKRNDALERENQELRDRLRKLDDVGNEIAIESARAEMESRTRTADLIEKRLIPIAQSIAIQKLQSEAAAAVGVNPDPKNGQHEKPRADA